MRFIRDFLIWCFLYTSKWFWEIKGKWALSVFLCFVDEANPFCACFISFTQMPITFNSYHKIETGSKTNDGWSRSSLMPTFQLMIQPWICHLEIDFMSYYKLAQLTLGCSWICHKSLAWSSNNAQKNGFLSFKEVSCEGSYRYSPSMLEGS
jgi:hypothetical protein